MNRESILKALLIFFVDLPKAFCSHCWIYMFLGLGIFVFIGHHLSVAVSLSTEIEKTTTGVVIAIALTALWLVAFSIGVKIRPIGSNKLFLYPPFQVVLSSFIFGFIFVLGLALKPNLLAKTKKILR